MKLIKVLIIAFILFMSGNVNSAQILIEFRPNNEYYAQCNNNQYTLLLRNTDNIKPRIIFNGGNNQLRFNKLILNNIDSLNINSNVSPIGIDTIERDHFTNVSVNNQVVALHNFFLPAGAEMEARTGTTLVFH